MKVMHWHNISYSLMWTICKRSEYWYSDKMMFKKFPQIIPNVNKYNNVDKYNNYVWKIKMLSVTNPLLKDLWNFQWYWQLGRQLCKNFCFFGFVQARSVSDHNDFYNNTSFTL